MSDNLCSFVLIQQTFMLVAILRDCLALSKPPVHRLSRMRVEWPLHLGYDSGIDVIFLLLHLLRGWGLRAKRISESSYL